MDNVKQAVESLKSWNFCATFAQKIHMWEKYIPSAKTLYTEDLSYITFNCLSEN